MRRMSRAAKARIAADARRRWARIKGNANRRMARRRMSGATKARLSAITKARWKKVKAAGKTIL